jgi:hypothetical protein
MQNIVLSEQDHFIIDNPTQCLAMVGKNFCKFPIKVRAGVFRACFCAQKHDYMEEGLSREAMYKRMYLLKQVGDEVTELEGLLSSESFSLHRLLCDQLIAHMKRYKTLQAKFGADHPMVRRMSSIIEMMEKQVRLWKMINKNRDEILSELKIFTGSSAFSSTTTSRVNSGTSTPCSANNGPRPQIAKRASSSSFGEPTAKRTAPVSNNTMDVDDDPYVLDGLRSLVTTPLPRSPAITPQPRSPIASPSYNMDSAAAAAKWKATKEAMYAALDEDEAAEEDGADDVLSDEEWSEDEEATPEDQEFINDDDDDDLISWRSNASPSGLSDEMANL